MSQTKQSSNLPVIIWSGQRVTTTELLARQYGTDPRRITNNFQRNKDRFIEGKHYHRTTGNDLETLRTSLKGAQVSNKARSLLLWTKRGAARHAKMLETNQAWDVFEALEESYFEREEAQEPSSHLSTVRDREPILIDSVLIMTRHHISLPVAYRGLSHFVGVDRFRSMSRSDVVKAHQFAERMLTGQDTDADWRQLQINRAVLTGQQTQLELGSMNLMLTPRSLIHAG